MRSLDVKAFWSGAGQRSARVRVVNLRVETWLQRNENDRIYLTNAWGIRGPQSTGATETRRRRTSYARGCVCPECNQELGASAGDVHDRSPSKLKTHEHEQKLDKTEAQGDRNRTSPGVHVFLVGATRNGTALHPVCHTRERARTANLQHSADAAIHTGREPPLQSAVQTHLSATALCNRRRARHRNVRNSGWHIALRLLRLRAM